MPAPTEWTRHHAGATPWRRSPTTARGDLLPADGGDANQVIAAFARAGVDASALAGELQRQGADAFVASWQDLLDRIGARHEQLSR